MVSVALVAHGSADPLAAFSDLDYPGRRKPVNREVVVDDGSDTDVWDAHPTTYRVGGVDRKFYFISAVEKALGYSQQSIRAWERAGLMPKTPYRSPRTRGMVAGGRSNKGRRLWTKEQIEGMLRIAKVHGVILPDANGVRRPPTKAFANEVGRLFAELAAD
jgi:hypothetical protein